MSCHSSGFVILQLHAWRILASNQTSWRSPVLCICVQLPLTTDLWVTGTALAGTLIGQVRNRPSAAAPVWTSTDVVMRSPRYCLPCPDPQLGTFGSRAAAGALTFIVMQRDHDPGSLLIRAPFASIYDSLREAQLARAHEAEATASETTACHACPELRT